MRFHATLELGGRTATGVEVPADVVTCLGSHKRPAVTVTINGYSYRSTVATMGGRYMLPVSAEVRKHAGVEAGDALDVDVELDDQPREVIVPDDLAAALDADPAARSAFDALTYSNQRAHVMSVEGAKAADTRARRITKIVDTLG
jgi:bifunctional DNA-binding transcriptional regulator/antitoxin component of YhaV-PrlF toxin-antitoxin module